jgi:hypothetical protein
MLDNEHDGTRSLLRKSTTPVAPAGLEDRVMLSIGEVADKRAKTRAALSGLLKCVAIGLMAIAVGQAFIPGSTAGTIAAEAGRMTEQPGVKVVWFLKNTYFLIPLLGLWLFNKIYRLKAAG